MRLLPAWVPRLALVLLAGSMLAGAGCGSSPEPVFYALAPTRGVQQSGTPHAIRIRRPGLAGYLDRPEIVRRVVDYRLGVAANERWGEPLDMMLARVLAQDVEQRLPGTSVFIAEGAITADPDATVEVDVQRFDVGDSGEVNLVAQVAVEHGQTHANAATRAVKLAARPKADGTGALVATMSDLLGQLADQIVVLLRSPPPSAPEPTDAGSRTPS